MSGATLQDRLRAGYSLDREEQMRIRIEAAAKIDALRKALDRYRYAKAWSSADAWDGCSDCRARMEWAASLDDGSRLSNDRIAEIGKTFLAGEGRSLLSEGGGE